MAEGKDDTDRIPRSELHVSDLLDSSAVPLPQSHDSYPLRLQLVLFELFSSLQGAATLRREGKDRAAAIEELLAFCTFVHRFDLGGDLDLSASSASLESALTALDQGVVEPLLRPAPSRGRGSNSRDRETVIAVAVFCMQHLRWIGMSAGEAQKAIADTLNEAGFKAARGSRSVKPGTVRFWRAQIAEDVGLHTPQARFVADMLHERGSTTFAAFPPAQARQRILGLLRQVVRTMSSAILEKDSSSPD